MTPRNPYLVFDIDAALSSLNSNIWTAGEQETKDLRALTRAVKLLLEIERARVLEMRLP